MGWKGTLHALVKNRNDMGGMPHACHCFVQARARLEYMKYIQKLVLQKDSAVLCCDTESCVSRRSVIVCSSCLNVASRLKQYVLSVQFATKLKHIISALHGSVTRMPTIMHIALMVLPSMEESYKNQVFGGIRMHPECTLV
jgi:hypothetical protein